MPEGGVGSLGTNGVGSSFLASGNRHPKRAVKGQIVHPVPPRCLENEGYVLN